MRFLLLIFLFLGSVLPANADAADPFRTAVEHRQKGRYAEAQAALDELANDKLDAARLAIEKSLVWEAVGEWKELTEALEDAAKSHGENPDLLARLAEVYFRQGRYDEAEKLVEKVLKLDGQHPLAHLVLADVAAETGRLELALENYVWFVQFYNRRQPEDAQTLELVAKGSLQYARWKGSSQILKFVVNTLCPDMLKDDELAWRGHYIAGDLLLEKYNRAQALPELNRALAINPRAAEVLVSLGNAAYQKHDMEEAASYADRALKVNPHHIPACWLKADVLISEGQLAKAKEPLQTALEINPHEQRTLARLAAVLILQDRPLPTAELEKILGNFLSALRIPGPSARKTAELDKVLGRLSALGNHQNDNRDSFPRLLVELLKRNPHPGYFLSILAETLESRRKYDLAELFYKQAVETMPELSTPKTSLGMLYMRVGKTEEATKLLDDAFDADPFHVRVSNMRKVLKVLNGYETIATDHFVIRVDSEFDKVLGRYMADYLESIYPELTKQFGYEPPQRTHFEIYNKAKGLSAHEWFSARMVGLPWIQTIGASTGVIVALASPTATGEPFNWARVLKHEFVHVITLQQTKFNIPHWFTEALAVTAEGGARPEIWNQLLLARVPKGEIRSLDELNDGFIRPKSPADWQFAYCQSRLYAQYMIETFGEDTIPKMLDCYRRNVSTKDAIPQVFGVDVETFEKGYRDCLDKQVTEVQGSVPEEELSLAELEKALASKPDDAKTLGKYAAALLAVRKWSEAKETAEKAIAIDKTQPDAVLALATLALRDKNTAKAIEYLEAAVTDPPHGRVLEILARLKLIEENYVEARDLYRQGHKAFPHGSKWLKGLAAVAIKMDDGPALKESLRELSEREIDNAAYPKKLAQLAMLEKDYDSAKKFGMRTLHVDVMDAETHQILARAHESTEEFDKAIQEYNVTLQLAPATTEAELGLARCLIEKKELKEAALVLEKLLAREADNQEAQELLQQARP